MALSARANWKAALSQAKDCGARMLALEDPEAAASAEREKRSAGLDDLRILSGEAGTLSAATAAEADVVVHAIPGFQGIAPLLASLEAGKRVAFAGKEALVSAGDLVEPFIRRNRDALVPVDSEHSALFQCLNGEDPGDVDEIVLTASGGALRDMPAMDMIDVTPEEVLNHPTWRMGKKVTVDSASLFNKALEVMEAHHLFGVPYSKIKVAVQRTSVVHSMVTFRDGTTKAVAARPDMRVAIAYAITYPRRAASIAPSLAPYVGAIAFEKPDTARFPNLLLGYKAGEMGGTAPCVLSLADEILVEEFLSGRIGFLDIGKTLSAVLDGYESKQVTGLAVLSSEARRAERKVRDLTARKETM